MDNITIIGNGKELESALVGVLSQKAKQLKLGPARLEKKTGIHRDQIKKIFKREADIRIDELSLISNALGYKIEIDFV